MRSLTNFFDKFENFLTKLQNSDERTKRRWMIIFVSISMILVIFMWLKYFEFILPQLAPAPKNFSLLQKEDESFWQTIKTGFKVIFGDVKEIIEQFKKLNEKVQLPQEETIIR